MGPLKLPAEGSVYVDSNCLIYSVEKVEPYSQMLDPLWQQASTGSIVIVCSELSLLEILVKPLRAGDQLLLQLYTDLLLNSNGVLLLPMDRAVIRQAAQLRATHRLNTPDAIHAATAELAECAALVTNDPAFSRLQSVPITILSSATTDSKD